MSSHWTSSNLNLALKVANSTNEKVIVIHRVITEKLMIYSALTSPVSQPTNTPPFDQYTPMAREGHLLPLYTLDSVLTACENQKQNRSVRQKDHCRLILWSFNRHIRQTQTTSVSSGGNNASFGPFVMPAHQLQIFLTLHLAAHRYNTVAMIQHRGYRR